MLYLGLILIFIGIWQSSNRGRTSPFFGLLTDYLAILGVIFIFVSSWRFGIGAAIFVFIFYIAGSQGRYQKMLEKRRVTQILAYFSQKKKEDPSLADDQIGRMALRNIIQRTYKMSVDSAEKFVNEITLRQNLDPFTTCLFGITQEYVGTTARAGGFSSSEKISTSMKPLDGLRERLVAIFNKKGLPIDK